MREALIYEYNGKSLGIGLILSLLAELSHGAYSMPDFRFLTPLMIPDGYELDSVDQGFKSNDEVINYSYSIHDAVIRLDTSCQAGH